MTDTEQNKIKKAEALEKKEADLELSEKEITPSEADKVIKEADKMVNELIISGQETAQTIAKKAGDNIPAEVSKELSAISDEAKQAKEKLATDLESAKMFELPVDIQTHLQDVIDGKLSLNTLDDPAFSRKLEENKLAYIAYWLSDKGLALYKKINPDDWQFLKYPLSLSWEFAGFNLPANQKELLISKFTELAMNRPESGELSNNLNYINKIANDVDKTLLFLREDESSRKDKTGILTVNFQRGDFTENSVKLDILNELLEEKNFNEVIKYEYFLNLPEQISKIDNLEKRNELLNFLWRNQSPEYFRGLSEKLSLVDREYLANLIINDFEKDSQLFVKVYDLYLKLIKGSKDENVGKKQSIDKLFAAEFSDVVAANLNHYNPEQIKAVYEKIKTFNPQDLKWFLESCNLNIDNEERSDFIEKRDSLHSKFIDIEKVNEKITDQELVNLLREAEGFAGLQESLCGHLYKFNDEQKAIVINSIIQSSGNLMFLAKFFNQLPPTLKDLAVKRIIQADDLIEIAFYLNWLELEDEIKIVNKLVNNDEGLIALAKNIYKVHISLRPIIVEKVIATGQGLKELAFKNGFEFLLPQLVDKTIADKTSLEEISSCIDLFNRTYQEKIIKAILDTSKGVQIITIVSRIGLLEKSLQQQVVEYCLQTGGVNFSALVQEISSLKDQGLKGKIIDKIFTEKNEANIQRLMPYFNVNNLLLNKEMREIVLSKIEHNYQSEKIRNIRESFYVKDDSEKLPKEIQKTIIRFEQQYGSKGKDLIALAIATYGLEDPIYFNRKMENIENVLNMYNPENIPDGMKTSLGIEYEVTKSINNKYNEKSDLNYKAEIELVSASANIGRGNDAVHEIATKPTYNPYLLLAEMKLLQDAEFLDLNFIKYKKASRGFHLSLVGDSGLKVDENMYFLNNLLTMSQLTGITAGNEIHETKDIHRKTFEKLGDHSQQGERCEIKGMNTDSIEQFEKAIITSHHAGIAIQLFNKYIKKPLNGRFRLITQVPENSHEFEAMLIKDGALIEAFATDQEREIVYEWIKLQSSIDNAIEQHNENFYSSEFEGGFVDKNDEYIDTGEHIDINRNKRLIEEIDPEIIKKHTKFNPEHLYGKQQADFINTLTQINNIFLKPPQGTVSAVNAGAALSTVKKEGYGSILDGEAQESIFDTNGKMRDGYYCIQGASEEMIVHKSQILLNHFNKKMQELLSAKGKKIISQSNELAA